MGTHGYMAPEVLSKGNISVCLYVYVFFISLYFTKFINFVVANIARDETCSIQSGDKDFSWRFAKVRLIACFMESSVDLMSISEQRSGGSEWHLNGLPGKVISLLQVSQAIDQIP